MWPTRNEPEMRLRESSPGERVTAIHPHRLLASLKARRRRDPELRASAREDFCSASR
jgi:hypothetical protein